MPAAQVRGVDKTQPLYVQRTKLAYVSNAQFKDEELTQLIGKFHNGVMTDMPVAQIEEMAAVRRAVVTHPQYATARAAQQQAQQQA